MLSAHRSLSHLIAHCSSLIALFSSLIARCSLLIARHSLLIARHSLLIARHSSLFLVGRFPQCFIQWLDYPFYFRSFVLYGNLEIISQLRFIQNSAEVPKYRDRRRAVSDVILLFPFNISVIRLVDTPSFSEKSLADIFNSSSSSFNISPG